MLSAVAVAHNHMSAKRALPAFVEGSGLLHGGI